jgi:hypothetical protein
MSADRRSTAVRVAEALPEILPCWRCGIVPVLDPNDGYPIVACSDCYDGAPDSSTRSDLGAGLNSRDAIEAWNEKAREESP